MSPQRPLRSYHLGLEYPYTVVPDNGAFFIEECAALPGCMGQVENAAEVPDAAEKIRTLWIEGEHEDGADIPAPVMHQAYSGKFVTRIPISMHRNLAVAAKQGGMGLYAWVGYLLATRNIEAQLDARLPPPARHPKRHVTASAPPGNRY